LLGLDQLKNHQACIDLQKNVLRIAGEDIPFLAEKDLIRKGREFEDESSAASASSAGSSSAAPSASNIHTPLNSSGANVTHPSHSVPSSQGSVATAANRPAGALSASIPPPGHSPSPLPPTSHNAAAVAAAQRRAAEANTSSTPNVSRTPTTQNTATSAPLAPNASASFPESVIETLTGLGFSRADSIRALTLAGGNAEMAAGYLFSQ
jgi:DNA damage-inducible protein 1